MAFAAAAAVYVRDGREHFLAIFGSDLALFGEMLPKVLAGCLIGAFVTLLLPRELVARWVGHESGFTGLAVAVFLAFCCRAARSRFTRWPVLFSPWAPTLARWSLS